MIAMATTNPTVAGSTKFFRMLRIEVERHASSGPMPVRNSRKDADRHSHAVIERRADRHPIALHVLRQHREQRPPQHGEARGQQNEVIEQEARFARDQRLQLVLGFQMVAAAGCR